MSSESNSLSTSCWESFDAQDNEEGTWVESNASSSRLSELNPFGNGRFGVTDQVLGTGTATDVALGDLDGDSDLDAVVVGEANVSHRIWWNDGEGHFADSGQVPMNRQGEAVALGDLDRDGDLDIFVGGDSSFMTWRNNGAGTFELWQEGGGGVGFVDMGLADLNGDGYLDAMLSGGGRTIWFNDGTSLQTVNAVLTDVMRDDLLLVAARGIEQSDRAIIRDRATIATCSENSAKKHHSVDQALKTVALNWSIGLKLCWK